MRALIPWALVVVGAVATTCSVRDGWIKQGEAAVRDSIAAVKIDSLTAVKQRKDTLYVRDTVTRWQTVRETQTLLDTLMFSDTVTLTVRESVIVFAADSAIQACRFIVQSCEQRLTIRDSLLSSITADRNRWRTQASPSAIQQARTKTQTIIVWEAVRALIRGLQK